MRSKKGEAIPLGAIIGLVFALIIFVPSIFLASKLFGADQQAEENFKDFVNEIKDFAETSQEGKPRNFMLIMDQNSAIYGFSKDSITRYNLERPIGSYEYNMIYPKEQCENQNCICLCSKETYIQTNEDAEQGTTPAHEISCEQLSCIPIDNIEIGGPKGRDNFRFSRSLNGDGLSPNQRNLLYFVNQDGKIIITTENE
jgi:hypothetical protein